MPEFFVYFLLFLIKNGDFFAKKRCIFDVFLMRFLTEENMRI